LRNLDNVAAKLGMRLCSTHSVQAYEPPVRRPSPNKNPGYDPVSSPIHLLLNWRYDLNRVPKKTASWCLIITLANVDRFSKFFQQGFARKFFMYISQRCPPNLQYVATIPCESRQSKNVTKFSYWTWQLICLSKIKCEILCNLPQKYRTNDFNSMCVQHMKYSLERTKTVHCEDNHGEKIATMQQCSTE